jgi:hypothetical protein
MTWRPHPVIPFSPFVIPPQSQSIFTSASSISGVLTPGIIPPSVPREVRFEMIRGKLEEVEHFKAEDIGIGVSGRQGYNIFHGWDEGPLPIGLAEEDKAVDRAESGASRKDDEKPNKVFSPEPDGVSSHSLTPDSGIPLLEVVSAASGEDSGSSVAGTIGSVERNKKVKRPEEETNPCSVDRDGGWVNNSVGGDCVSDIRLRVRVGEEMKGTQ